MGDDIDPRKLSQFGFAKLLGTRGDEPVEYLVRKLEVILGRNSKNSTADVVLGASPFSLEALSVAATSQYHLFRSGRSLRTNCRHVQRNCYTFMYNRAPAPAPSLPRPPPPPSSLIKVTRFLDAGESMSISRKHAVIRYNFEANCFELIVMGKNGRTNTEPGYVHLFNPDVHTLLGI